MRLIFFLLIATLGLYSCNNDLTTIGQDLINNGNHIEVQTTLLKETGTIKIDSFITSSGRYGSAITEMFMGRYKDQYSGVTTASPCFQIVPVSRPSINFRYLLDSVTFHFKVGKNIWEIRQKQLLLKHFHFIVWPACRNSGQTKTTTFITGILFHGEINWQQSVLFPKG